jgi:hypothetical protein
MSKDGHELIKKFCLFWLILITLKIS